MRVVFQDSGNVGSGSRDLWDVEQTSITGHHVGVFNLQPKVDSYVKETC